MTVRAIYHTKPLLDFVNLHGDMRDRDHIKLRAELQAAYDCNAGQVMLSGEHHHLVVRMQIESKNETLLRKAPANDSTPD